MVYVTSLARVSSFIRNVQHSSKQSRTFLTLYRFMYIRMYFKMACEHVILYACYYVHNINHKNHCFCPLILSHFLLPIEIVSKPSKRRCQWHARTTSLISARHYALRPSSRRDLNSETGSSQSSSMQSSIATRLQTS